MDRSTARATARARARATTTVYGSTANNAVSLARPILLNERFLVIFIGLYKIIASGASFLVCSIARAVYIMVRTSFRKCTPFLNSEYNFQFYRRVFINLQQYRVRRNPRAQRCSVF